MAFTWEGNSPEGSLIRRQSLARERGSFDRIVHDYLNRAEELLAGGKAGEEVARFAGALNEAKEGLERDDIAERLFGALNMRGVKVPEEVETKSERAAFGVALARSYIRSLQ